MTDNYANHPPSISEIRSDKSMMAADWTPRDALISVLREIDEGLNVEALVISYCLPSGQKHAFRHAIASKDMLITRGLLAASMLKTETRD